jgi:hypothetical protein
MKSSVGVIGLGDMGRGMARKQVPAADVERCAPGALAGIDGGLREGRRQRSDQDLPGH